MPVLMFGRMAGENAQIAWRVVEAARLNIVTVFSMMAINAAVAGRSLRSVFCVSCQSLSVKNRLLLVACTHTVVRDYL